MPTYKVLHRQSTSADKPYQELKRKRYKGKQRAEAPPDDPSTLEEGTAPSEPNGLAEFYKENAFLQDLIR